MLFGIKSKNNHIPENYTFPTFFGSLHAPDKTSEKCKFFLHNWNSKKYSRYDISFLYHKSNSQTCDMKSMIWKTQKIVENILILTAPLLTLMSAIILVLLSKFNLFEMAAENPYIYLSYVFIAYAVISYIFLMFKSKSFGKKIDLTVERWFTVYPKLVISIPISIMISYPFLCYGVYIRSNFISVVIVTLTYLSIYQLTGIVF